MMTGPDGCFQYTRGERASSRERHKRATGRRAGRCKVFHDLQDRTLSTRLDIDVVSRQECGVVGYALYITVVTDGWGSIREKIQTCDW